MKNFHFGVLAFLPGLSKCFHLSFLSDFFFTLCILKNHSSSLSAIFALPGFFQEIKNTYYRELSVAAVCTYYIVISFNHKRLKIPSDLCLIFRTMQGYLVIILKKTALIEICAIQIRTKQGLTVLYSYQFQSQEAQHSIRSDPFASILHV